MSDAAPADAAASRYAVADQPPWRLSDALLRWETILIALLALVVIGNTWLSPYFFDIYNLSDATFNFSEKAIIALAMTLTCIVVTQITGRTPYLAVRA